MNLIKTKRPTEEYGIYKYINIQITEHALMQNK